MCAPTATHSPWDSHSQLAPHSKLQKAPADCPAQARSMVSEPGFPLHMPGSLPDTHTPSLPPSSLVFPSRRTSSLQAGRGGALLS